MGCPQGICTNWLDRQYRHCVQKKVASICVHHLANAPSNIALRDQEFLVKHNFPALLQLPYRPDLTLTDFVLFPRIKTTLKGGKNRRDVYSERGSRLTFREKSREKMC